MDEETVRLGSRLRVVQDLDGYSTVWIPGSPSSFIIKSASTPPHVINLADGEINSLCSLNISSCQKGFAYIDRNVITPPWVLL